MPLSDILDEILNKPLREDRGFDFWYGYTSDNLSKLCTAFGLPTSGTKKEKAARLCFAYEIGLEPRQAGVEATIVQKEYEEKLRIGDIIIPDPAKISSWIIGPPNIISIFERKQIMDYFSKNSFIAPDDINGLNKYTTTVSYTLFKSGRVADMKHYECENNIQVTIISCRCGSTMTTKDYNVWIALNRWSLEVLTGYCGCLSGLHGCCKHLFAALFALEYYSDTGESNPACTSQPRQWGQQASSTSTVPPTPTSALKLRRHVLDHEPKRPLRTDAKDQYDATPGYHLTTEDKSDIIDKLGATMRRCGIFVVESMSKSNPTIRTVENIIEEWRINDENNVVLKMAGCYRAILDYFTDEQVIKIEMETRDQSKNPTWFEHRIYRITASLVREVLSAIDRFELKVAKTDGNHRNDFIAFFGSLIEEAKEPWIKELLPPSRLKKLEGAQFNSVATQYGRDNEPTALLAYLLRHKCCDDAKLEGRGLLVDSNRPYLGASLDGLITCAQHGKRLVEVKCPERCSENRPQDQRKTLADIYPVDEETGRLEQNPHYWQQMMQMGVSGVKLNDLFLWSPIESFCETVEFDEAKWKRAAGRLEWYFVHILLRTALK